MSSVKITVKILLILVIVKCNILYGFQWRDSATYAIPSPAGKKVRITQISIGDTNTNKNSGAIAYTNNGFYAANGSYYVLMGGSGYLSADSSLFVTTGTTQVVTAPLKYYTGLSIFLDTTFFGIRSTLNNELANLSSNSDADFKLWTASTSDLSSINLYRSRGTITSPSDISPGDVVGQLRGFGYKGGFKELANISFTSVSDTTADINFNTRTSSGLINSWRIKDNGTFEPTADNISDIGRSSAFRPRNIYSINTYVATEATVAGDPGQTIYGEKFRVNDAILALNTINVLTVSNINAPVFHTMRALAGPSAVTAGTSLGSIGAQGYDGTDYGGTLESGLISFSAVSNFTPTSHKTRTLFATTDTLQPRNWWQIEPTGELLPSYGDGTGKIGNATSRIGDVYAKNGTWNGRITSTDIVVTDSVSGVTGDFTSTLSAGSTGSATVALMRGSGAFPLATYRGTTSISSASGIRFDLQNSSSAQAPYATAFGQIMSNTASLQSGALGVQTYKSGSAVRALLVDSIQNVFLGPQSNTPLTDTRLLVRSNVTGLYAFAVIPSNSTTKAFAADTVGRVTHVNSAITSGDGVVSTIDTVRWTAQDVSISSQNFANVVTGHKYKIVYYINTKTAGTGGTVLIAFGWTDSGGAKTHTSATADLTSVANTGLASGDQFVYCSSGNITWATTVDGATGSPTYDVDITLTRYH